MINSRKCSKFAVCFILFMLIVTTITVSGLAGNTENSYELTIPATCESWEDYVAHETISLKVNSLSAGKNAVCVKISSTDNENSGKNYLLNSAGDKLAYKIETGGNTVQFGTYNSDGTAIVKAYLDENKQSVIDFTVTDEIQNYGLYTDKITFSVGEYVNTDVSNTVSFNVNPGSGTINSVSAYKDLSVTIPDTIPTYSPYTFLGWKEPSQKVTDQLLQPGSTYFPKADISLEAVYAATWQGAKAVLCDNGNMTFVYDTDTYILENTYTDNIGETTITEIYKVPENNSTSKAVPWEGNSTNEYRKDITTINIDESFKDFAPKSTVRWFKDLRYVSSITNAKYLNMSNCTSCYQMFYYFGYSYYTLKADLSEWDMSSVTNCKQMFYYAGGRTSYFNINCTGWDMSSVTNCSNMFYCAGCQAYDWSIGDLSEWDMSSATDCSNMFYQAGYVALNWSIGDLSEWDMSNVTNCSNMFRDTGLKVSKWSIGDLSGWDMSNVTNCSNMFYNAGKSAPDENWLVYIVDDGINTSSNWKLNDTCNATPSSGKTFKFRTAKAILGDNGNLNFVYDGKSYTAGQTYTDNLGKTTITAVYEVPQNNSSTTTVPWGGKDDIIAANIDETFINFLPKSTAKWFAELYYLANITGMQNLNMSACTDCSHMFEYAGDSAESWSIDLSNWDMSACTDCSHMFASAGFLADSCIIEGLSNWDMSACTNCSHMFFNTGYSAYSFSIGDLSNWVLSACTNCSNMFNSAGCWSTEWSIGDLSNWDMSACTNCSYMFAEAGSRAESWSIGDLSKWNMQNVTSCQNMFDRAGSGAPDENWLVYIDNDGINTATSWKLNDVCTADPCDGKTFKFHTSLTLVP